VNSYEKYLSTEVNNLQGPLNGLIDALIGCNRDSRNHAVSSGRFCNSPFDIGIELNSKISTVDFNSKSKQWKGPSLLNFKFMYQDGQTWIVRCPLQIFLRGWGDATKGYQGYVHSISHKNPQPELLPDTKDGYAVSPKDWHYVGITGRTWTQRLKEHVREMKKGSPYKFHQAWVMSRWGEDTSFVSYLMQVNLTYEEAMKWEELRVDQLGEQALNMIPGGFKGHRELYKRKIIKRMDVTPEEREIAIKKYNKRNQRSGYDNPKIAEYWKDYAYYLKTIGARPKTLSETQVQMIRKLHSAGNSAQEILKEVGAINIQQVKNVISGRTYRRIPKSD
jgi:hypothetical protein